MQKKIWLLALAMVGAVLLSGTAAWADSEFYVIAGGGVGTRITSVPVEIKNSGFYYLTGNLNYSGSGNAITVSANDVTLDLMGFSLSNTGAMGSTNGISMQNCSNVEIRNGTVRGFYMGVEDSYPNDKKHRVINVRATNNNNGIWLYSSSDLVKNCSVSDNTGTGISIAGGLITDSVANSNGIGIQIVWGPGSVLGNTASGNTSHNFYFGAMLGINAVTSILVDRNSALGLSTNYAIRSGMNITGVLITATNSGQP